MPDGGGGGISGGDAGVLDLLRAWVRTHFGIQYSEDQRPIFASRIESVCLQLGRDAVSLLAALHAGDRAAAMRLAEAVSTNHTYFLREAEVLEVFAQEILPSLAKPDARVWSAAASSGDEAYTLAILAAERMPDVQRRLSILGTDISQRQIRTAEEGIYPTHQIAPLGAARGARWFRPVGLGQHQIAPELRQLCTFRRMNLTQLPWPFERRFDVIFLRNVLFYFDRATRQRIVDACFDVAEPGAWLLTSLTEPMLDVVTRWTQVRPAIYRKTA